jgi:hypothetical protein
MNCLLTVDLTTIFSALKINPGRYFKVHKVKIIVKFILTPQIYSMYMEIPVYRINF